MILKLASPSPSTTSPVSLPLLAVLRDASSTPNPAAVSEAHRAEEDLGRYYPPDLDGR